MTRQFVLIVMSFATLACPPSFGGELVGRAEFSALASDRKAASVGDILTIIVYENASARNSASSGSSKDTRLEGRISASRLDEAGSLGVAGSTANTGSTSRSGQMVAQISATVERVLPNGDLDVVGQQYLDIAGERTLIKVRGRVRASDISAQNAVLSNRLADAQIEYNGKGFVSRGAKPGIVSKLFGWLGLL